MAVSAPDREVPRADNDIVGTGELAVPAGCILHELPDRVPANLCQETRLVHIFTAGNEDPGGTTVVAGHLGLIRYGLDDLVCNLFAVVAVRAVFREDKTVAQERIVEAYGFINLIASRWQDSMQS